ncbi:uncharacterized protein LOC111243369 [Varroa destructor]|uniref:Uncharacterized protein n=2 Tax=Varroa TaxID=62624 RepID=A0A7M7J1A9_VARDE|nr:uncharacterized protein LOC111243369 [Varroa destructor]
MCYYDDMRLPMPESEELCRIERRRVVELPSKSVYTGRGVDRCDEARRLCSSLSVCLSIYRIPRSDICLGVLSLSCRQVEESYMKGYAVGALMGITSKATVETPLSIAPFPKSCIVNNEELSHYRAPSASVLTYSCDWALFTGIANTNDTCKQFFTIP